LLKTAAETQSARAASRRAQFQLWIFSYTILVGPSKKYVSRVMIDFINDFAGLLKGALAAMHPKADLLCAL
jgi:hypothetical protein